MWTTSLGKSWTRRLRSVLPCRSRLFLSLIHISDDYIFDVEKKDSIKTLLLTLWKSEDDKVTKTESGELGSACLLYTSLAVDAVAP